MKLYSDVADQYSQRVRLVLAEKGIAHDLVEVDIDNKPEELANYNPYNALPTLVDRDISLYNSLVVMEYLDERFPHPPLLPPLPVERAQSRLFIARIEKDWGGVVNQLALGRSKASVLDRLRTELRQKILTAAEVFTARNFFMSDEFSMVDCCIAPILWRLEHLGVSIPSNRQTNGYHRYCKRVFNRDSFQKSLSDVEREMGAF